MEQPLITISLCYDCTNLHEPYDPPILVFCKFRFQENPGGNELLLMPDQPCGIHFHRSWRTQILQHPFSATLRLTCLIGVWRQIKIILSLWCTCRFYCHVCNLFCLCCKAPWAFNQNGYGAYINPIVLLLLLYIDRAKIVPFLRSCYCKSPRLL